MEIHERIRYMRKLRKMSQDDLARLADYGDRSTISRIEKGEIDLPHSKVLAIADALRCSPQYILFGDECDVVLEKVKKLDEYDLERLSAYLDGMLDQEKYVKKGASDIA